MTVGAFVEPLVVISLLVGGTWVNRERSRRRASRPIVAEHKRTDSSDTLESGRSSPRTDSGLLSPWQKQDAASTGSYLAQAESNVGWRRRRVGLMGWQREVWSPDTRQFSDRLLSRLLQRFPFLVEVWYWALIYWVYQLGRAFTAVMLVQGTVHTARGHAIQLIHLEQSMGIFWEAQIQNFFLQYPAVMHWINRIYSFIHIPGTILFLIGLFYITITANSVSWRSSEGSPAGPGLYQARRRTMAMCNLIAFIVFTVWPCMPPRLLSDPNYQGKRAQEARSFGFVDTVHGADGAKSLWTQNKFCNQYAAMPSLHFGYSLLIGLTVALLPLPPKQDQAKTLSLGMLKLKIPSTRRLSCVGFGFAYPTTILVAIVATANHFILDAVAGALVCGLAWKADRALLNLQPLEDWFLWCLRIAKPEVELDVPSGWDEKAELPIYTGR